MYYEKALPISHTTKQRCKSKHEETEKQTKVNININRTVSQAMSRKRRMSFKKPDNHQMVKKPDGQCLFQVCILGQRWVMCRGRRSLQNQSFHWTPAPLFLANIFVHHFLFPASLEKTVKKYCWTQHRNKGLLSTHTHTGVLAWSWYLFVFLSLLVLMLLISWWISSALLPNVLLAFQLFSSCFLFFVLLATSVSSLDSPSFLFQLQPLLLASTRAPCSSLLPALGSWEGVSSL